MNQNSFNRRNRLLGSGVYSLADPRDGQIYYIGSSSSIQERIKAYQGIFNTKKTRTKRRVDVWLQELADQGYQARLTVLQLVGNNQHKQAEMWWIRRGKELGWPLLNEQIQLF